MPRYPTKKMEIEQCEPESVFLDDVTKIASFVNANNNTLSEYLKVTRMYLFGTPIRRIGSSCYYATPGCIRLKLYSSKQEEFYGCQEAFVDDVVDFPLGRNGDLDFERVKLWWGIKTCSALDPYDLKIFQQGDPNKISGIAIHNLSAGRQNAIDLLYVPTEADEYRRKEQGSWIRDLKWHRRMFVYDPAWYFNRLVIFCALFWLLSLIPGAFSALSSTFIALKSAVISLIFTVSVAARWMRVSLIPGAFSALSSTFIALKSAVISPIFTDSVAARWMREVELTLDPRMTEAILRSLM